MSLQLAHQPLIEQQRQGVVKVSLLEKTRLANTHCIMRFQAHAGTGFPNSLCLNAGFHFLGKLKYFSIYQWLPGGQFEIVVSFNHAAPSTHDFVALNTGASLEVEFMPSRFNLFNKPAFNHYYFVGLGIGFVPFYGMLGQIERLLVQGRAVDFLLGMSEKLDLIAFEELAGFADSYSNFNFQCFFSRPSGEVSAAHERVGRVTPYIKALEPLQIADGVFLSGPKSALTELATLFTSKHCLQDNIITEIKL